MATKRNKGTEKKLRKRKIKVSFEILDIPAEDEDFIKKEMLRKEVERNIYNIDFTNIAVQRLNIKVAK